MICGFYLFFFYIKKRNLEKTFCYNDKCKVSYNILPTDKLNKLQTFLTYQTMLCWKNLGHIIHLDFAFWHTSHLKHSSRLSKSCHCCGTLTADILPLCKNSLRIKTWQRAIITDKTLNSKNSSPIKHQQKRCIHQMKIHCSSYYHGCGCSLLTDI